MILATFHYQLKKYLKLYLKLSYLVWKGGEGEEREEGRRGKNHCIPFSCIYLFYNILLGEMEHITHSKI